MTILKAVSEIKVSIEDIQKEQASQRRMLNHIIQQLNDARSSSDSSAAMSAHYDDCFPLCSVEAVMSLENTLLDKCAKSPVVSAVLSFIT